MGKIRRKKRENGNEKMNEEDGREKRIMKKKTKEVASMSKAYLKDVQCQL